MVQLVYFALWNTTRRCAVSLPVCNLYRWPSPKVQSCGYRCYVRHTCVSILLYADDILLLSPSLSALQLLLSVCEKELQWLDMSINAKKSACLLIGPRYNAKCKCITTSNGGEISWVNTLRYLGVHICAAHKFSCSVCDAKKSFYHSFNCIFGKIGRIESENVMVELLKAKCLPSFCFIVLRPAH